MIYRSSTMARATIFIFVGFLAVSQVLGESTIAKFKEEISKAEEWIENETTAAKSGFAGAMNEFKDFQQNVVHKVESINGLFDRALEAVESTPPECHNDIRKNLMVLKSSHVGSFLTCTKLLEAGKDIFEIGMTSFNLVSDVIDIGRDVTLGFSNCLSSFWPWRIIECWYDRISTTYDDIKQTIADVKNYASDISGYAHNATEILKDCWHGSSVQADVLAAMKPVHQCAKQPVPYHIYRL